MHGTDPDEAQIRGWPTRDFNLQAIDGNMPMNRRKNHTKASSLRLARKCLATNWFTFRCSSTRVVSQLSGIIGVRAGVP